VDKRNNLCELKNGPRIETRITYSNNKRTVFYFDSLYLKDNTVVGITSRFIPSLTLAISLDEITKVEIQDGHKRYKYI